MYKGFPLLCFIHSFAEVPRKGPISIVVASKGKRRIFEWTSERYFPRSLENLFCIFQSFIVCREDILGKKLCFPLCDFFGERIFKIPLWTAFHLQMEFFTIYCSSTWCIRRMIMHGFLFPISEFQEGIHSFKNSCETRVLDSSKRNEMIIEGCSKGLLSNERNSPLYQTLFMSYIYQFLCVNPFYKLLNNRKYSYARLKYPMAMKTFTSI